MNVRCNYCHQSFNLSRDFLVDAVAEATEKRQKYHTVECINCRKAIKVPLSQMKRYVPSTPAEEDES
jgi:nitrate/TMAO reductase-like tetraheme cytochrome c subunit